MKPIAGYRNKNTGDKARVVFMGKQDYRVENYHGLFLTVSFKDVVSAKRMAMKLLGIKITC